MREAISFLQQNPAGGFATISDNKPKVRPFQFMLEENGKIIFSTSNKKNVYKEMEKNPYVSFTSIGSNTQYIRIDGKVKFINDVRLKDKVLDTNEIVKSIYKSGSNPDFEIFYFENGKIILADLLGNPSKEFDI
jgi:uncharacterized pyridoxamine 5'-phosphate oxidase family protein